MKLLTFAVTSLLSIGSLAIVPEAKANCSHLQGSQARVCYTAMMDNYFSTEDKKACLSSWDDLLPSVQRAYKSENKMVPVSLSFINWDRVDTCNGLIHFANRDVAHMNWSAQNGSWATGTRHNVDDAPSFVDSDMDDM